MFDCCIPRARRTNGTCGLPKRSVGPITLYIAKDWEHLVEEPKDALCSSCRKYFSYLNTIVDGPLWPRRKRSDITAQGDMIAHHDSNNTFAKAVEDGCVFCVRILDKLERNFAPDDYEGDSHVFDQGLTLGMIEHTSIMVTESTKGQRSLHVLIGCDQESLSEENQLALYGKATYVEFIIRQSSALDGIGEPSILDCLKEQLPLQGVSTECPSALQAMKRWYHECREEHGSDCDRNGFIPTRLLQWKDGKLRLILTCGLSPDTPYAALSHCWGQLKILRLIKENLEACLDSISIHELCQTFRDTLFILDQLSLEFVWIDSLCIIQNDAQDWEKEAALMGSVYGFAQITIAASHAVDGSHGLFSPRKLPCPVVIRLAPGENNKSGDCYVDCRLLDITSAYKAIRGSNLPTRAWAFQERVLSNRMIFFNDTQLSWLCRRGTQLESNPELYDTSLTSGDKGPMSYGDGDWREMVEQYSACKLTYESDRLVAFSGLAKQHQKASHDVYLAGLWLQNIERQLCWGRIIGPLYQEQGGVPSWSWASSGGQAVFEAYWDDSVIAKNPKITPCVQVTDWHITLATSDPFGAVKEGMLTLRCAGLLHVLGFQDVEDQSDVCLLRKNGRVVRLRKTLQFNRRLDINYPYYILPVMIQQQQKMRSSKMASGEHPSYHTPNIIGLIVAPVSGRRGQYRRVGHVDLYNSSDEDWVSDLSNDPLGSMRSDSLRCTWDQLYASCDGEDKIITLV